MSLFSLPVEERLACLQEFLSVNSKMYVWCYDPDGNLLETNCPDKVLDNIFESTGCKASMLEHAKTSRQPLVLGVLFGLLWSCAYEYQEEQLLRIHVFGPVTTSELSYFEIRKKLQNDAITPRWRTKLIAILQRIPVTSTINFFQHTLMLHYCVTGEKLTTGEILFETPKTSKTGSSQDAPKKDRLKTWMTEQALMNMISEGNLNYKSILHEASIVSSGVRAAEKDSLKHARLSSVVFVTLATRAAIAGGISPEVAYTRGDAYIRDILECRSVADAAQLSHSMYDDFVRLVHAHRTASSYSKPVRSTCDYIELHAEEKLTLSEIAGRVGYADYYLSRKFKEETGLSIHDYIKKVRINRAKLLLLSSDLSIQEISQRLCFGSRSFFAETFRKIEGIPPAAFREQKRRI